MHLSRYAPNPTSEYDETVLALDAALMGGRGDGETRYLLSGCDVSAYGTCAFLGASRKPSLASLKAELARITRV